MLLLIMALSEPDMAMMSAAVRAAEPVDKENVSAMFHAMIDAESIK